MKYSVGSDITSERAIFTAPDNSSCTITQATLQQWIHEGGDGAVGITYALSQFTSVMNMTFSNWVRTGYFIFVFDTNGAILEWETGSAPGLLAAEEE